MKIVETTPQVTPPPRTFAIEVSEEELQELKTAMGTRPGRRDLSWNMFSELQRHTS